MKADVSSLIALRSGPQPGVGATARSAGGAIEVSPLARAAGSRSRGSVLRTVRRMSTRLPLRLG